jgi:hypothetical protein
MTEATARSPRWSLFRRPDTAGAIYGTIAAMAVIAGAAASQAHGKTLYLTVATLLVFWVAHVYAQALSHHLKGATRLDWAIVRAAMAEEWPLIQGPLPLLIVLALGRVGVLEERTSIRVALWLGVANLVAWGYVYARSRQWRWHTAVTAGAVNGLLGLAIVLLEVVIH